MYLHGLVLRVFFEAVIVMLPS